jgi:hypothetical protein
MYLVLGKVVQKEEDFVEHSLSEDSVGSESVGEPSSASIDEEIKQLEDAAIREELARDTGSNRAALSPLLNQTAPLFANDNISISLNPDFDDFFRRFQEQQGINYSLNANRDEEY